MKLPHQEPAASPRATHSDVGALTPQTRKRSIRRMKQADHLAVTDHRKCEPRENSDREKQSANGCRNFFNAGLLTAVACFHRCHDLALQRSAQPSRDSLSVCSDDFNSDAFAIWLLGAFDRSEIQIRPHAHGDQGQRQSDSGPLQHQFIAVGICHAEAYGAQHSYG